MAETSITLRTATGGKDLGLGPDVERRVEDDEERNELLQLAAELPWLKVDPTADADLELFGDGALAPLTGFMGRRDLESVLDRMRLEDGQPWSIPIVLGVAREEVRRLSAGRRVALRRADGEIRATLELEEVFEQGPAAHARAVFGTDDPHHPGARRVLAMGETLVSGLVTVLRPPSATFSRHRYTPRRLRSELARRGWRTVVAFQTRNPIHRAHEYLMKCALESVDGLLLHPLVGQTKSDDLSAEVRMRSYEVLLRNYFNPTRTMLAVLPGAMRYAGPREAVFHAILRRNYGCTHLIIGRDHAGAQRPDGSSYYGSYDAHGIFYSFAPGELGITPLFYDHAFYCRRCEAVVTKKTAPSDPAARFTLSGTKVRELLRAGIRPPPEITRPEVADVLIEALRDEQREREVVRGGGI